MNADDVSGWASRPFRHCSRRWPHQVWRITDPATGAAALLDRTTDTTFLLEAQTVGAVLSLEVRAVNETGEGPFSPVAQVTVT